MTLMDEVTGFDDIPIPEQIVKHREVFQKIARNQAEGIGITLSPQEAEDAVRYAVAMENLIVKAMVIDPITGGR